MADEEKIKAIQTRLFKMVRGIKKEDFDVYTLVGYAISRHEGDAAQAGYDDAKKELEAELTQAHADNAKLETLWENAVAARDKLSEDLTRARAERAAAREAPGRAEKERYADGWRDAVIVCHTQFSAEVPIDLKPGG